MPGSVLLRQLARLPLVGQLHTSSITRCSDACRLCVLHSFRQWLTSERPSGALITGMQAGF